jgi:hypothetical protein
MKSKEKVVVLDDRELEKDIYPIKTVKVSSIKPVKNDRENK